jgi:host factor-I protein
MAQEKPPRAVSGPMQTQERDRQMENKPAQNIQDSFLNTARKDKSQITIYLLSGVKLTGRIRSFDKYSVVLETNNQEQLIFKHAISTVVMAKGSHYDSRQHGSGAEGESNTGKSEG